MNERYSPQDRSLQVVARAMRLFHRHGSWLALVGVATLFSGFSAILLAKGIQGVSDAALTHDQSALTARIPTIVAALVVGVLASFLTRYASGRYSSACTVSLLDRCQEHIATLDMAHMDGSRTGDLLARMTYDVNEIGFFLEFVVLSLVSNSILLATALTYMLLLNWKLTLISSVAVPLFALLVVQVSKKMEGQMKLQQESYGNESNVLEDAFMGLPELKAFGLGDRMYEKYCREVDNTTLRSQQMYRTECRIIPIGFISGALPFLTTLFYGGTLVLGGGFTLGGLLAYISLSNNVSAPIHSMQRLFTALRTSVACLRRIFETWNYPQERTGGGDFPAVAEAGEVVVAFDDVTFGYGSDSPLFEHLGFEVRAGEKIALVGASGCGKSTVLKLIAAFYRPSAGGIRVFGHDVEAWDLRALRGHLAEVLQDSYLFPDTIGRNIAYGRLGATQEEIERAARDAYLEGFVDGLGEKYATLVGERGVKLSGGQRQRVAVARALLKDAPILLLDEATSALDTESEREVQVALERLMRGRTALIVAHRLSTIRTADRILVMDQGRIVEEGTHDALFARGSVYRQLYERQFRESDA